MIVFRSRLLCRNTTNILGFGTPSEQEDRKTPNVIKFLMNKAKVSRVKEKDTTYDREKDCLLINVKESSELSYWSKKLGVSIDILKTIVRDVGPRLDKVKARLGKKR